MSTGRSNRPLFDLLDGARNKSRAPDAPARSPYVEIKPKPVAPPAPRIRPESSANPRVGLWARLQASIRPFLGDSTMTLPANAVYYSVAGVILLILLAWIIGYRSGSASRAKELKPFADSAPIALQEPSATGNPSANQATPAPRPQNPAIAPSNTPVEANQPVQLPPPQLPSQGSPTARPAEVERSSTANPTRATDVFLAAGWTSTDPREPGLNYLYLPYARRDQVERFVRFLAANSVQALAVPYRVDLRGSNANNPPPADALYRVVLRQGFTGEQLREQTIQASVKRLAEAWKRDNSGVADFSASSSWEKLVESR